MTLVFRQRAVSSTPASMAVHGLVRSVRFLTAALRNRYSAARALSGFDDRMLADIGLRREDIYFAFAEPIWRDPTAHLASRAAERRAARRNRRSSPDGDLSSSLGANERRVPRHRSRAKEAAI